jgi:hypothetical protein
MNKILKIFLALILTVSMLMEIIPVNIVHAEGEGEPVDESAEVVEAPAEEEKAEEPAEPVESGSEKQDQPAEASEAPADEEEEAKKEELPEAKKSAEAADEETEKDEPEEEKPALNTDDHSETTEINGLFVTVEYGPGTVPAGTVVKIKEASPAAIEAIKAERGENVNIHAADISFIWNNEEIEPSQFAEEGKTVKVTLHYEGEDNLTGNSFETVHVAEEVDDATGEVVYSVDKVDQAKMTDKVETVSVPYEYTWTETVTKYKDVDVYEDVEVPYEVEKEVPVYETREKTEERTQYVTKTRMVEKTRTVKVKVAVKWYDPSTWLGYKYVTETYTVPETYKEAVTVTVVVGTEEVQVGTKKVTEIEYRTESRYVRTDKIEDGTEEVVHTETRYKDEEIVVGQTAEFDATDFSTYALTWRAGAQNRTVTIHVGYLSDNNNNFIEFAQVEGALDTSGTTINLKEFAESVMPTGYAYIGARYSPDERIDNNGGNNVHELSTPILTKVGNDWRAVLVTGNSNTTSERNLENGNHIYIFCENKGAGSYTPPKPEGSSVNPETIAPNFAKQVTANADGTYTIKLDITGHQAPVQEGQGANVIIVLDTTKSMRYDMDGNDPGSYNAQSTTTRMYAAKSALGKLVSVLKPGDGTGDTNLVNVAFIEFNNANNTPSAHTWAGGSTWTSNQNTLNTYISGLTPVTGSGTNWENGLHACENLLATIPGNSNLKNNVTYVIFVTDGDPNRCEESNLGEGNNNFRYNAQATAHAQDNANNIANLSYLYGVFCGNSTGADRLETLITVANGKDTISAGSQTDLEQAFENIGNIITSSLGSHSVNMDDGIPSLASIQQTVTGEATDFTYYKNDEVWTDAPEAEYNPANGVVWDLEGAGKLEDNTKYSIEFTIWPTQASYDLIADLNNGLRSYDPDGENPISNAERNQIEKIDDTHYTLKTNTHLYASYVNEADGETYNIDNVPYEGEHMPLPTETISVKKLWPKNLIDSYGAAVYRDPETGETKTATEIQLQLQRENTETGKMEDYLDILVTAGGKDNDVATKDDNWMVDNIYVSVGFMTVKDGVVEIKETGHDYQIVEPPEFLYYWDLISDVYHPMVINGTETVLIYDPELSSADPANGIYEIPANSGRIYKTGNTSGNTLEASNYRRSNLNLSKIIPEDADKDSEFVYKVKVTDAYSTDGYVWFSAWDYTAGGLVTDTWVTGSGVVAQGDGYFYAPNGTELTMTIKTNWNVRFLNVYHGTTFSIEETGMPGNFEFDTIETDTQYDIMLESNLDWYNIETTGEGEAAVQTGKITGTITEPNNNYYVTYNNKVKPEFYIYHSSVVGDGDLETISMVDKENESAWNADGTFDLFSHAKEGTLYGGYYLDYAGKGDYADDGVPGTTGVKYTGMNYLWSNPETTIGTAMTPVAGETYYIKEVPTYYLRNYHQITYVKATGKLTGLYLISATDDKLYQETGLYIQTSDKKTSKVATSLTYLNTATNKSVTLKANTVFKSLGITGEGSQNNLLTYFEATNTSYFAAGSFTVLPYWKTPDGIEVKGISTRTITIADDMTKSGISKVDE